MELCDKYIIYRILIVSIILFHTLSKVTLAVTMMFMKEDLAKRIIELFRSRGFSSSVRIGIMIYLHAKKKAFFMDMVSDLDITPGNLWNHLVKLQGEGYTEIKYVLMDRPRRLIVLTKKGLTKY